MKCPHCDYKHGWDNETMTHIEGKEGDFFYLSNEVEMLRDNYHRTQERAVYGCPSCLKLFMGD